MLILPLLWANGQWLDWRHHQDQDAHPAEKFSLTNPCMRAVPKGIAADACRFAEKAIIERFMGYVKQGESGMQQVINCSRALVKLLRGEVTASCLPDSAILPQAKILRTSCLTVARAMLSLCPGNVSSEGDSNMVKDLQNSVKAGTLCTMIKTCLANSAYWQDRLGDWVNANQLQPHFHSQNLVKRRAGSIDS